MTELKTLKDFRPNSFLLEQFDSSSFVVDARVLKKEAIKWIKFYEEKIQKGEARFMITQNFIKHFFNITEKDLK